MMEVKMKLTHRIACCCFGLIFYLSLLPINASSKDPPPVEPASRAPVTPDRICGKGQVVRTLTWNDNETTPCMAVIVRDDGKAFEAYARASNFDEFIKYAASAVCDTLISAQTSKKSVEVCGDIEESGTGSSLGSLAVVSVDYLDEYSSWSNTGAPDKGALVEESTTYPFVPLAVTSAKNYSDKAKNEAKKYADEAALAGKIVVPYEEALECYFGNCQGHGRIIRVLNWTGKDIKAELTDLSKLCMTIIQTPGKKIITANVTKPKKYDTLKQGQVIDSMLKMCHDLTEGLSSQNEAFVEGELASDGSLDLSAVNVLNDKNSWGDAFPTAF